MDFRSHFVMDNARRDDCHAILFGRGLGVLMNK